MVLIPRYNKKMSNTSEELSATEQIDNIIKMHGGWKGELLTSLRRVIRQADPKIFEEIKWKMKNRPEGLPVWSNNGIVCFAEIWKDNIKLLFPKGAKLDDPKSIFNARLQSQEIRAVEFKEGYRLNEADLGELVTEATKINKPKSS